MSFDPVASAGLVTREVRSGFRDGVATKIAIARRVYLARQADLWDAVGVGWDLALMGLGRHMDSGAPVDPRQAAAFTASPDGADFIRAAAAGWSGAAVADGDDPGSAQQAAARVVAFYTPPSGTANGS